MVTRQRQKENLRKPSLVIRFLLYVASSSFSRIIKQVLNKGQRKINFKFAPDQDKLHDSSQVDILYHSSYLVESTKRIISTELGTMLTESSGTKKWKIALKL